MDTMQELREMALMSRNPRPGDPGYRCPRHGCQMTSDCGDFDVPCAGCEAEMDADDEQNVQVPACRIARWSNDLMVTRFVCLATCQDNASDDIPF
jgi:hypothetical protein